MIKTMTTIPLAIALAATLSVPVLAAGDWNLPQMDLNSHDGGSAISGRHAFSDWQADCNYVTFRQGDGPTVQVSLNSSLIEKELVSVGEDGQRRYQDRVAQRNSRTIIFERRGGELAPWERDRFKVCLKGHDYWAEESDTAYSYSVQTGMNGSVVATAGGKYRTRADSDGLYLKSFGQAGGVGAFQFVVGDKWARHYGAGEQVAIQVELKKNTLLDETILEKTVTFESSETYTIDFSQYAHEMKKDFENGKEYFVKWSFQRVGNVSTDDKFLRPNTRKSTYNSGTAKAKPDWQPW